MGFEPSCFCHKHTQKRVLGSSELAEGACKIVCCYFLEVFLEQALQDPSQSPKAQKFSRERTEKKNDFSDKWLWSFPWMEMLPLILLGIAKVLTQQWGAHEVATWVRTRWTSVIWMSILLNHLQTSQKKLSLKPQFLMLLSWQQFLPATVREGFFFYILVVLSFHSSQ